MELKEYHETLEKVLTHLKVNHNATADEVRALSSRYWAMIKEYLKDAKVVSFLADGTIWSINKQSLDRCLADIEIKIGEYQQERKRTRNKRLWEVMLLILDALIAFYAGWFLRGCTPEHNATLDNPDHLEQSSIICDSTMLSELSFSCLNADNTPSLAKSLTVISDNSASTRLMCNTLKSSMRIEAVQLSFSELPLLFSPSGKLYVTDIFIPQI